MKYLIFDRVAITKFVSSASFQNIEEDDGIDLINHICLKAKSGNIGNIIIKYLSEGIIFTSKDSSSEKINLLCIDLTTCDILSEEKSPNDLLTVMQKTFRLALKIWDRKPFSQSERFYETKSILFPFVLGDRRRLVIERSNHIGDYKESGVDQPLLAYKYSAEDPANMDESVNQDVLILAIRDYLDYKNELIKNKGKAKSRELNEKEKPIKHVETLRYVDNEGFRWLGYNRQYLALTDAQRSIVDYDDTKHPLRIEGPAGTGKTVAMLMRAYNLLRKKKDADEECRVVFFSHNESTTKRNRELFGLYDEANLYLSGQNRQSIMFVNLLEFCRGVAGINTNNLLNITPENVKEEQLQWIMDVLENSRKSIKTYRSLLSHHIKNFFDVTKTPSNIACKILQHEFSIQIKGRTNASLENYKKIKAIKNGLPYENEKDQELIFLLFTRYQNSMSELGVFDADDVVMEALSRLNAPVWRRERKEKGYDMIFVDEMHLFNLNEQSVFHFLSRNNIGDSENGEGEVPICFALDYAQAIGDQGDVQNDYFAKKFRKARLQNLNKVFRNSKQILDFCESIAASGTLMFQEEFKNPYKAITNSEDKISSDNRNEESVPKLFMYVHEDAMLNSLKQHITMIMKNTQCRPSDIAVIDFNKKHLTPDFIEVIEKKTNRKFKKITFDDTLADSDSIVIASPYDINGLEFKTVILMSVDSGYLPEKYGVSDISKHFLLYSSYNLLYLAASRARNHLILLGNTTNGMSPCFGHAVENKTLTVIDVD